MTSNDRIGLGGDAIAKHLDRLAERQGISPADIASAAMMAALAMSVRLRGPVDAIENLHDVADIMERELIAGL